MELNLGSKLAEAGKPFSLRTASTTSFRPAAPADMRSSSAFLDVSSSTRASSRSSSSTSWCASDARGTGRERRVLAALPLVVSRGEQRSRAREVDTATRRGCEHLRRCLETERSGAVVVGTIAAGVAGLRWIIIILARGRLWCSRPYSIDVDIRYSSLSPPTETPSRHEYVYQTMSLYESLVEMSIQFCHEVRRVPRNSAQEDFYEGVPSGC